MHAAESKQENTLMRCHDGLCICIWHLCLGWLIWVLSRSSAIEN